MIALFLDLETTGTDPKSDRILEIGCILHDIASGEEIWRGSWLSGGVESRFLPMDPVVHAMHTASGLFDACDEAEPDWAELDILKSLHDRGHGPGTLRLAGFSPHFDRAFLREHMPLLQNYLHYRNIDVSTLRTLTEAWVEKPASKVGKHRALADCEEAIEELGRYRKLWDFSRRLWDFRRTTTAETP